ncbi:MAG: hypothetical protein N6V41_00950, partial [Candidatus Portiera aleyrodidarum]|nr:hypothetical protein [Candidatus Portiera aleyrodidarum]
VCRRRRRRQANKWTLDGATQKSKTNQIHTHTHNNNNNNNNNNNTNECGQVCLFVCWFGLELSMAADVLVVVVVVACAAH